MAMGRCAYGDLWSVQRARQVYSLLGGQLPTLVTAGAISLDGGSGAQQLGQLIGLVVLLPALLAAFRTFRRHRYLLHAVDGRTVPCEIKVPPAKTRWRRHFSRIPPREIRQGQS